MRRAFSNLIILLFVLVSSYYLVPSIKGDWPKAVENFRNVSRNVISEFDKAFKNIGSKEVKSNNENYDFSKGDQEDVSVSGLDVITETNKQRQASGLPNLIYSDKLSRSAKLKVEDMIEKQYFEHNSPEGITVSNLGTKVGYTYLTMGENLAMGDFKDSEDVVLAWMESSGHRANILNSKYQEIGVFAKKANYKGDNVWFVVQHFGTSRNACPIVDQGLKVKIEDIKKQMHILESGITVKREELESPDAPVQMDYNQKIEEYNNLVIQYKSLAEESRKMIDRYNSQVKEFNACLIRFQ